MKRLSISVIVLLAGFFSQALAPSVQAQTYSPGGWHYVLSQYGRNEAMWQRASSYPRGQNVAPLECLGWVQTHLQNLTGATGVIKFDPNDKSQLLTTDYIAPIIPQSNGYYALNRGNIIQCLARERVGGSIQHTMIIESVQGDGMWVRDCNYVAANTVGRHFVGWGNIGPGLGFNSVHYYYLR